MLDLDIQGPRGGTTLAKLTREQIVTIEVLQQRGHSQSQTARPLGVSEGTVRCRLRRPREGAADGRQKPSRIERGREMKKMVSSGPVGEISTTRRGRTSLSEASFRRRDPGESDNRARGPSPGRRGRTSGENRDRRRPHEGRSRRDTHIASPRAVPAASASKLARKEPIPGSSRTPHPDHAGCHWRGSAYGIAPGSTTSARPRRRPRLPRR